MNKNIEFTQDLHPYFVTGFSDAESSFIVNLLRRNNLKMG